MEVKEDDMDNLEIKILSDDYAGETLKLFNDVFGLSMSIDFWKNKHFKNPCGKSFFFGVFDNDNLIAMNAFMPMQFVYKNKLYNVVESCESAVALDYRNRGIFSKIIKYAEAWLASHNYDFIVGFPNINSYPGFMKLGWEVLAVMEHFGKIVNLGQWIEEKKGSNIRPLADSLLLLNYLKSHFLVSFRNNYKISKMEINDFLLDYQKNNKFIRNKYDADWLRWRLASNGGIFTISEGMSLIVIFIILDNTIVYLDDLGNETCDVVDALKYFGKQGLKGVGEITIYVNQNSEIIKRMSSAGFVTKREPQQTRIVKRLSTRAINMEKDVAWLDQML